MENNESTKQNTEHTDQAGVDRSYEPPTLTKWGNIAELTHGGEGGPTADPLGGNIGCGS